MKTAILGTGAIGSIYAARLAQNPENEILCVVKSADHCDRLNNSGITITDKSGNTLIHAYVRAAADTTKESPADLVLISVKSHTTLTAVTEHKSLFGPSTTVLTLQNGYGNHTDILSAVSDSQILMGTTAMGVNINAEGRIILAGEGKTVIGALTPDNPESTAALDMVCRLLSDAGFETETTEDSKNAVLNKLLINVGINAVCTLNNLENRFICENDAMRERSYNLVTEAVEVLNACGSSFDSDTVWNNVLAVAEKTGSNVCSMLQDARSGRMTEIHKINGAIVKLAESAGMDAPHNRKITREIEDFRL